jgi:hypothetical protein
MSMVLGAGGMDLSATRVESTLVALESLTQRIPAAAPHSSSRCSTPLKALRPARMAAGLMPRQRARSTEAMALCWLCSPGIGGRGNADSVPPGRRARI